MTLSSSTYRTVTAGPLGIPAIEAGDLTERRYANYLKVRRETHFHDLTYAEKRQRDKNFGKHIKAVLKHKGR